MAGGWLNPSRVAEALGGLKLGPGRLQSGVYPSNGRSPAWQLGALFRGAGGSREAELSPASPG